MFKRFWQNGRDFLIRPQSNIFSAALVIALTYGISMLLGILRERILVAKFFACCRGQLDSYYAAFRLPDIIFQLVVIGALSSAFIPIFSDKLSKDRQEAYRLSSSLINLFLFLFLILCLVVYLFTKPLSLFITGSFTPQQIQLMVGMTRVMLLAQVFFLISNFLSAMIQSQQRFLLPSLSAVVYNLGIIISVSLFADRWGIWSAAIGVVFGAFLHLLIQVPLIYKLGYRHLLIFEKTIALREVIRLMVPRTLALAAGQIEVTFSVFLATSLSAGSLTLYSLAQRLVDLPVRLLGTSVGQAALPTLSAQLAQEKKEDFKKTLNQSLSQLFYFAFPATALFLVLRLQAVRFAYGAKSFPWEATVTTGQTLAMITLSIFSQSAIQLLVRAFYAFHDTLTPFLISLISVFLNVGLSLYLIKNTTLGILGLATAFSATSFINFLLLFLSLNYRKIKFVFSIDYINYLKMFLAASFAGFCSWSFIRVLDKTVFDTSKNLPLLLLTLICGLAGVFIYFFFSLIFKIDELRTVFKIARSFGRWRDTLFSVKEVIEPHSGTTSGS
jgi:putative peptidoglycan lipid II flippase